MRRRLPLLALAATLAACDTPAPAPSDGAVGAASLPPDTAAGVTARWAQAEVRPVGRSTAQGTVTLTAVAGGVRVQGRFEGLSASGFHALQVLRWGDCSTDPSVHLGDAPETPHGGPYAPPGFRHAGDLGNVRGDAGEGRYDRIDPVLALDGPLSAVGRAVVVRAGRDDAASPDGAAGDVIACGVLEPVP